MSAVTKLMTPGGGGVALTPASSIASDVTVNVPSQNCTLGIQGPSFYAYLSGTQSFTLNTWTKVQLQTEVWDTASCFDNVTNYRFTPNIAGYYQVSGAFTNATILAQVGVSIYKNGSNYIRLYNGLSGGNTSTGAGSAIVYLNGTTDYIELYAFTTSTQNGYAQSDSTYFQAALVRAA